MQMLLGFFTVSSVLYQPYNGGDCSFKVISFVFSRLSRLFTSDSLVWILFLFCIKSSSSLEIHGWFRLLLTMRRNFCFYGMLRTFYWTFVVTEWHAHFHRTFGQTKTTCTFFVRSFQRGLYTHFSPWRDFFNAEMGISNPNKHGDSHVVSFSRDSCILDFVQSCSVFITERLSVWTMWLIRITFPPIL